MCCSKKMCVQLISALVSTAHMIYTALIWILMERECHPGNQSLLGDAIHFMKDPSSRSAIHQIKIHVVTSGVVGLLSLIAHALRHYHGLRFCLVLKLLILVWGTIGVIVMYIHEFDTEQLICFTKQGLKVIGGYFVLSIGHFVSVLWHINHVKPQNSSGYQPARVPKPFVPRIERV